MSPTPIVNHPERLKALASGAATFDTGVPCERGHLSPRATSPARGKCYCLACDGSAVRGAKRRLSKRAARMRVTLAREAANVVAQFDSIKDDWAPCKARAVAEAHAAKATKYLEACLEEK